MSEFERLLDRHDALIKGKDNLTVEAVRAYIDEVQLAGRQISDPRERNQMRAILRYWSSFVYQQTRTFPDTELPPAEIGAVAETTTPAKKAPPADTAPPAAYKTSASRLAGIPDAVVITGSIILVAIALLIVILLFGTRGRDNDTSTPSPVIATTTVPLPETETPAPPTATAADIAAIPATNTPTLSTIDAQITAVRPTDTPVPTLMVPTVLLPSPSPTLSPLPETGGGQLMAIAIVPDNLNDVQQIGLLEAHSGPALSVDYASSAAYLASAGGDGVVRVWDQNFNLSTSLTGNAGWVQSVAFSPDDLLLASGGNDTSVRLWSWPNGQPFTVFDGHDGFVFDVTFDPAGELVASAGGEGLVILWAVETGARILDVDSGAGPSRAIAFIDSDTIAIGNLAGEVLIVTLDDPFGGCTIDMGGQVLSLAYTPQRGELAAGNDAGEIILIDVASCQINERLAPLSSAVNGLAYDPAGAVLAAGYQEGLLWLYAPQQDREPVALRGPGEAMRSVEAVAFDPAGTQITTAHITGELRFWGVPAR